MAGILQEPQLDGVGPATRWWPIGQPVRANLLNFLRDVFDAGAPWLERSTIESRFRDVMAKHPALGDGNPDDFDDETLEALGEGLTHVRALECRDAVPAIVPLTRALLSDPDSIVRTTAVSALVTAARFPELAADRERLVVDLDSLADSATVEPYELCTLVLALGEFGRDTSHFLSHSSQAVRCCAALAPGQVESPIAMKELIRALENPELIDGWFTTPPPLLRARPLAAVVDAITKRASSIDEYVDASVAVAKVTHRYTGDDVLGPLLLAAMGTNTSGPSERLSRSQARFLRSLVANPAIWSPSDGSAAHWFQKVGIPHDRDACERLSRRTFRR